MTKIGIIGSGVVGTTLAAGFEKHGYQVKIGSRTPEKLGEFIDQHRGISTGDFSSTAAFADYIVLAVRGSVAQNALELAGIENLKGKVILDATNPISHEPPEDGVLKFFTSLDRSLMEDLQAAFPDAHFVKVFSSVGAHLMVNPELPEKPSMFIAGNNQEAKATVTTILDQFGWETEDMGTAKGARAIEPLCILWCIPGIANGQWNHAFKLLKK